MAVLVEVVEQQAGTTWHRLTTMMGLARHSEMEAARALVDCSQLSRKQRKTAAEPSYSVLNSSVTRPNHSG